MTLPDTTSYSLFDKLYVRFEALYFPDKFIEDSESKSNTGCYLLNDTQYCLGRKVLVAGVHGLKDMA